MEPLIEGNRWNLGLGLLVSLLGAFGGTFFLSHHIPPLGNFLTQLALTSGLAAVEIVAAIGCAIGVSRVLGVILKERPTLALADAFLLGLPLLGCLFFLLGLMTTAPLPMGLLWGAFASYGAWELWQRLGSLSLPSFSLSFAGWAALSLLVLALGLEFMVAQLPPWHLDELSYHLWVPQAWIIEGRVVELTLHSHSYFPMGIESASLPLLSMAGTLGARSMHMVLWLLACTVLLVLVRWLHRRLSLNLALVSAAVVACTPCLLITTGAVLVEWTLLGACLLVVVGLDDLLEERPGALVLLTLAWAAGVATKYSFGLFALIVAMLGLWLFRKNSRVLKHWLLCGVLGLVLGSTFLLRNLVWVGNPIAPFGVSDSPSVSSYTNGLSFLSTLSSYLFQMTMFDEAMGVALPLAALFGIWIAYAGRSLEWLRSLSVAMWLPLLGLASLGMAGRVLLPFLLFPALLGLLGLFSLLQKHPLVRRTATAVWFLLAFLQLFMVMMFVETLHPFKAFYRGEQAYMSQRRSFSRLLWLNKQLPAKSKTLIVGIQELYGSKHKVRGGGNADGPRIARYLEAKDAASLARRWQADGFTHIALYHVRIIVGNGFTARLQKEKMVILSSRTAKRFLKALRTHTSKVGTHSGLFVYKLHQRL